VHELQKDITTIHFSHNENDFADNKRSFKSKYSESYPAAYEYCATWFSGVWSNWQIFHNKPGQANTNSNIESFNNVIKKSFTDRKKIAIKSAIAAILKMCVHYATNQRQFMCS
jgi:hypothetical protein